MNLIRVYEDEAFALPLNDLVVYYSDDRKYKVMISLPLKHIGKKTKLITIGCNDYGGNKPSEAICKEILQVLNIFNATLMPPMQYMRQDITRYLFDSTLD